MAFRLIINSSIFPYVKKQFCLNCLTSPPSFSLSLSHFPSVCLSVYFCHDSTGHDSTGHDKACTFYSAGHDGAGHDSAGHDSTGHDSAGHYM